MDLEILLPTRLRLTLDFFSDLLRTMNLEKVSTIPDTALAVADRDRLAKTLDALAAGEYVDRLTGLGLFTAKELVFLSKRSPVIKELLTEAQAIRDEVRQMSRVDAADKRAVDGVEKPIYSVKGEYVGSERVYSDSLLALQLKANDPAKYAGSMAQVGGGFVLNVNLGIQRDDPKKVFEVPAADIGEGKG